MITIKDLSDYDKIKGLNETIDKGYPMVKKTIDGGLYERNDNAKRIVDTWLEKANALLKKQQPKEEKKAKPTKPKAEKKEPKKSKPEAKKEEEKPTKKPKTTRSETKKPTSSPKNGTKSEKKTDKTQKEGKPKVGENPAWLATLNSFVKSFAGKTKDTWRVRDFVRKIQGSFNAKLGQKTPNIDLIRDIQDKLISYANSDKKKVDIPAYADLVSKCKAAIKAKDFTVSKTVKKPEITSTSLSGVKKKRKTKKTRK
jgi:hypothetical protein